jgi:hypothetical protein
LAAKRGGRVPPPPPSGGWTLRFDTDAAAEGWEEVTSQFPGPTRTAFEQLERDPFNHSTRQHRLRGTDDSVRVGGVALEQWQYELTGNARIVYAPDPAKRTVWIIGASAGHFKRLEEVRGKRR